VDQELVGVQLIRRLSTFGIHPIDTVFVYLNRDALRTDVPRVSRGLFGPSVEGLLTRGAEAIRATVNGIVLVAVAEGRRHDRSIRRGGSALTRFCSEP